MGKPVTKNNFSAIDDSKAKLQINNFRAGCYDCDSISAAPDGLGGSCSHKTNNCYSQDEQTFSYSSEIFQTVWSIHALQGYYFNYNGADTLYYGNTTEFALQSDSTFQYQIGIIDTNNYISNSNTLIIADSSQNKYPLILNSITDVIKIGHVREDNALVPGYFMLTAPSYATNTDCIIIEMSEILIDKQPDAIQYSYSVIANKKNEATCAGVFSVKFYPISDGYTFSVIEEAYNTLDDLPKEFDTIVQVHSTSQTRLNSPYLHIFGLIEWQEFDFEHYIDIFDCLDFLAEIQMESGALILGEQAVSLEIFPGQISVRYTNLTPEIDP